MQIPFFSAFSPAFMPYCNPADGCTYSGAGRGEWEPANGNLEQKRETGMVRRIRGALLLAFRFFAAPFSNIV